MALGILVEGRRNHLAVDPPQREVETERRIVENADYLISVSELLAGNLRDLALFTLAIDSKLRGCDLVPLRVADLVVGDAVRERVSIIQRKTGQPVQFEVSDNTRQSIRAWVASPENVPRTILHTDHIPTPDNNWAGQNYTGYCNPEMDALIDLANAGVAALIDDVLLG